MGRHGLHALHPSLLTGIETVTGSRDANPGADGCTRSAVQCCMQSWTGPGTNLPLVWPTRERGLTAVHSADEIRQADAWGHVIGGAMTHRPLTDNLVVGGTAESW